MMRNVIFGAALLCVFAPLLTVANEVVASATGAWFAVDAREVKDTTWEGGAIIGGETNVVLQSSPNAWGEAGGGASATITWASTSGGSGTVAAATTADSVLWTPEARFGTNMLTYVSGSVVKTATFIVRGLAGVESVTARQRYPWNGMVDIAFTVNGDADKYYAVSFVATNVSAGTGLTMKTMLDEKGVALTSNAVKLGTYRWAWNAAADLPDGLKCDRVTITAEVKKADDAPADATGDPIGIIGDVLVIDVSAGSSAASYPSKELTGVDIGTFNCDVYKADKIVLRKIEPGTFKTGSPSDELGRKSWETQHQVTLTKGFYIGVFEVTQRQWELVMGTRPSYLNNSTYYASRPVEQVSYNMIRGASSGAQWPASNAVDADSFLGNIRAKTGLVFDLPTEAQWEYACRAGTMTALNSGKNLTSTDQDAEMDKVGRYMYNGGSGYSQSCDTSAATAKVGSYVPNAWGLYDMHGNVWEWCLDGWQSDLGTSAVTDPMGPTSGVIRDLRGGSWNSLAYCCRSAVRGGDGPSDGFIDSGFRLACSVGSSK